MEEWEKYQDSEGRMTNVPHIKDVIFKGVRYCFEYLTVTHPKDILCLAIMSSAVVSLLVVLSPWPLCNLCGGLQTFRSRLTEVIPIWFCSAS